MMDKIARKEYEMAVAQLMANKASHHQTGSGDDIQASLGAKRHVEQSGETGLRPLAWQPGAGGAPSAETAGQSPTHVARPPSESADNPTERSPRKRIALDSDPSLSATATAAAAAPVSLELDESHLMACLSENAQTETGLVIAVFDFGGQEVFDVLHHLFLTQHGVYVLCFNCEWLREGAPPADTKRCIKFLRSWLHSIVLHTYDAENKTCAPVVLVGTHCDIVSSPEEHEKISFKLNEELNKSLAWSFCIKNEEGKGSRGRANLAFFPVDNHQGRKDPVVQYMMRRIEEEMEAATYTHKLVPLEWFKTMDAIKATGKSFLQLSEVTSIAAACGVKQDQVELLLRLLHEMGHLLWLAEEPGLREVIILDAIEYLVKPATLVVCNHKGTRGVDLTQHDLAEHKAAARWNPDEWEALTETGVLQKPLLEKLWASCYSEANVLLSLMVKYGLIVPLQPLPSEGEQIAQFVVPALLPLAPAGFLGDRSKWGDKVSLPCTCYMVFSMKTGLKKMNTLTQKDLSTGGFMPSGLFERVLGKCISWCQVVAKSGYIRLQEFTLYKDSAVLCFGNQVFRLISLPRLNCIRVDVEGANPLPVTNRIMQVANEVIKECMRSLHAFVALPWVDKHEEAPSRSASFEAAEPGAAMLLPMEHICAAYADGRDLRGGTSAILTLQEIKFEYHKWLNIIGARSEYDVFLSYRWCKFDGNVTAQVFDAMTNHHSVGSENRRIEVFLDNKRLQNGEAFDRAFAKALINSTIIVPVVSNETLRDMTDHNAAKCDNVLLEWILALQCLRSPGSRVKAVYPILIGDITASADGTDQDVGSLFPPKEKFDDNGAPRKQHLIEMLSDIVPTKTIEAANALLRENGVTPQPALDTYTVASFFNDAFAKQLGYAASGCKASKLPSLIASKVTEELTTRHLSSSEELRAASPAIVQPAPAARATEMQTAATCGVDAPGGIPQPAAAAASATVAEVRNASAIGSEHEQPLEKLYAVLTQQRRCRGMEGFQGLQAYLQDEICVAPAAGLAEYVRMDAIMSDLRGVLNRGGAAFFDEALDSLHEVFRRIVKFDVKL